jgi:hypothetical protein
MLTAFMFFSWRSMQNTAGGDMARRQSIHCSVFFSDKQVVLDIEELDPFVENYAQRVRRKSFYLRSGFHETGRYTMFNGKRFEVLCNGGPLDTERFLDLVLLIHDLMPVYPGILL